MVKICVSLENNTMDTVLHVVLSKVHQQAKLLVHQSEVGLQLLEENRSDLLNRFQFDDYLVFYKDVKLQVIL